jgi:hypothetical protein
LKLNGGGKGCGKMGVFIVDMYVVRTEKQGEFIHYVERFLEYRKENPEKFKECKSWKIFRQAFGSISGAYIEMMEFDDLTEAERWGARMRKDEAMMTFREEFMPLIEPATHSMNVWNSVM